VCLRASTSAWYLDLSFFGSSGDHNQVKTLKLIPRGPCREYMLHETLTGEEYSRILTHTFHPLSLGPLRPGCFSPHPPLIFSALTWPFGCSSNMSHDPPLVLTYPPQIAMIRPPHHISTNEYQGPPLPTCLVSNV